MDKFSSFLDILQYRAIHQSQKIAYTFLLNGETESLSLTYQELERKAQAIAVRLQDRVTAVCDQIHHKRSYLIGSKNRPQ